MGLVAWPGYVKISVPELVPTSNPLGFEELLGQISAKQSKSDVGLSNAVEMDAQEGGRGGCYGTKPLGLPRLH